MKTIERDVIVVGSGPAGATCAAFLLRNGVDCLLVDRAIWPRDKPCGDGQAGVTTLIMEELGWLEDFREIAYENHGIVMTSPDYTKATVEAPLRGYRYDCPRRIFDDYLRRRVIDEGVEMLEDFWVYDLIKEDGFVKGVRAKYQGEYIEVRSNIVIGADGAHSIVAKKIGMFPESDNDIAVVGRCYYEDVDMDPYNEIHFDKDVLPGYVWLFPERDKMCNVGLGFNRNLYTEDKKTLEEYLDIWIEASPFGERLRGKRRVGEFRGWRIPSGSQAMDNYASGCIVIGDAGSMVMPLTGEGIGPAMVTAKMAAELSKEAIAKNDFSADMFKQYPERRHDMYDAKYKSIKAMESSFESPDRINGLVHKINDDPDTMKAFQQQWYFESYEKDAKLME